MGELLRRVRRGSAVRRVQAERDRARTRRIWIGELHGSEDRNRQTMTESIRIGTPQGHPPRRGPLRFLAAATAPAGVSLGFPTAPSHVPERMFKGSNPGPAAPP